MDLRDYELMYIVRPTTGDEGFPSVVEQVNGLIGSLGGEAVDNNIWGKRRLAYPINDHEDGYYVVSHIRLGPEQVAPFEDRLRISDDVIRHIVVEPIAVTVPRPPRIMQ